MKARLMRAIGLRTQETTSAVTEPTIKEQDSTPIWISNQTSMIPYHLLGEYRLTPTNSGSHSNPGALSPPLDVSRVLSPQGLLIDDVDPEVPPSEPQSPLEPQHEPPMSQSFVRATSMTPTEIDLGDHSTPTPFTFPAYLSNLNPQSLPPTFPVAQFSETRTSATLSTVPTEIDFDQYSVSAQHISDHSDSAESSGAAIDEDPTPTSSVVLLPGAEAPSTASAVESRAGPGANSGHFQFTFSIPPQTPNVNRAGHQFNSK